MTFIHHKNGTKERFCPSMGITLTIKEKKGKIEVTSDLPKTSIYEKKWNKNN
jgi:hypothetical protein